jgi:hypothetical protein
MWHCLKPPTCACYLCPAEIVRRLEREFAYVETSEEVGRRHVLEVVQQLTALRQTGRVAIDDQYLTRLCQIESEAVYVHFGDDPTSETSILGTPVVPEEPLIFEYLSPDHRESLAPLVTRCAAVLGYEVIGKAPSWQ